MRTEIKLFALAKQLAGCETINVDLPEGANVSTLRQAISRQHPELSDLVRHALFAVNTEYADDTSSVPNDAEIALIPPVSGG